MAGSCHFLGGHSKSLWPVGVKDSFRPLITPQTFDLTPKLRHELLPCHLTVQRTFGVLKRSLGSSNAAKLAQTGLVSMGLK